LLKTVWLSATLCSALALAPGWPPLHAQEADGDDDSVATPAVDSDALFALKRMGEYLRSLDTFEITADTARDEVADTGENVEFASHMDIKARLPDRMRLDITSDRNQRQYFYDGKTVVIYAPAVGAYATFEGAPTIRDTLEIAADKYDLELPFADLFTWGTPDDDSDLIIDAFSVGLARIGGEDCEHFVFRQEGIDWQLWVRTGDAPLPCRLVITTTDEPSQPRYAATLDWNLDVELSDDTFTFTPNESSYQIPIESSADEDAE
jgi:hypothetical protein